YDTLKAINSRLIYCSITGYGRNNPHSQRPAYDALVAARTGLQWEFRGWPEGAVNHMARRNNPLQNLEIPDEWIQGPPRNGPVFSAVPWPSLGAFYSATTAVSAALYARELTGIGQWVEASLLQGVLCLTTGNWQRAEKDDAPGLDTWIMYSSSPRG